MKLCCCTGCGFNVMPFSENVWGAAKFCIIKGLLEPITVVIIHNNCLDKQYYGLPVNGKDAPPAMLTRFGLVKDGFDNNAFFFLRFCFPPFAPLA